MAATGAGLLAFTPGDGALTAAGWVWPPAAARAGRLDGACRGAGP